MIRQREDGSALVVSLIFMLLLTLVGLAGIQSSTNQERMAANVKFKNDTLQAAEAGLRVAENILEDHFAMNLPLPAPCVNEGCNLTAAALDIDSVGKPGSGWWELPATPRFNNARTWYRIQTLGESLAPAKVPGERAGHLYRIEVVSYIGTTRTVLESVYVLYI
jgi:type IV pilus assembly protein PilX